MNVQKVERFNGGGGCMYAFIWELDKFIVVGDNTVTIWNSEKEFFNAIDGKHSYPQEVLEYNTRRIGERT